MQPSGDDSPITTAMVAQERLRSALSLAGFTSDEFPQMWADVDLGVPCVRIGAVSTDTADHLADVIATAHRAAS